MVASHDSLAVRTRGLGKRFSRAWALAHFDIEVPPGEVLLVAGANGSGKTTLLRLIAGLYKPDRGSVRVFGRDVREERLTCRRRLTLIGHHNYLYGRLTPLETLRLWSRLAGHAASEGELTDLLATVELRERRHSRVGGFSAGMKKRLTLLRTQIERPGLVLLDEPFSALDQDGRELVERWIADFARAGKTVVMASHDLVRSTRLCDRALLLRQGQLVWQGPGAELPARLPVQAAPTRPQNGPADAAA